MKLFQPTNSSYPVMFRKTLSYLTLFLALTAVGSVQTQARQAVQVSVTGIPPILSSPFVSELETNFRTGVYQVQLNYLGGTAPVDVYFTLRLTKDGQILVEERSRTITYDPGFYVLAPFFDEINFERSEEQIFRDIEGKVRNQVLQSGALPEGNYVVTIDVRAADPGIILTSLPGISQFMVRYPQPPILLTPSDRSEVSLQNTIFTWTPVLAPAGTTMEYDFIIVEVYPRQNPGDALLSNRAHQQETLVNLTTLPYGQDLLPFEIGKEYAWQVTARDSDDRLPMSNRGASDINTFTFTRGGMVLDLRGTRDINEITLIPGFAKLVNFDRLEVTETSTSYELNGSATAVMQFSDTGKTIESRARLNNLTIQKTGLSNPVIMGGGVGIDAASVNEAVLAAGGPVELTRLQYVFGEGIVGSGRIATDQYGRLDASGSLALTPAGLFGELVATGRDLIRYDGDIISVVVDEVVARFPEQSVYGRGRVEYFGEPSPCRIAAVDLSGDNVSSTFWCEQQQVFPLGQAAGRLSLNLNRTTGSLLLNRELNTITYDLQSSGVVTLSPLNSEPCGIRAFARLQNDTNPDFTLGGSTCTIPEPELDLGFASLLIRNIQAERFAYESANRDWDFAISFDARIRFALFNNWTYSPDEPFRLTQDGIDIPRLALESADLPAYNHHGVRMKLTSLAMDSFTFPWFTWQGTDAGPWNLDFTADARFADRASLPVCLGEWEIGITEGRVRNGQMSASFAAHNLESCRMQFGTGHALNFMQISGNAGSRYDGQTVEAWADLDMRTRFEAGAPFHCGEGQPGPADATLNIRNGLISGQMSGVETGCDIQIGPFTGSVSAASLLFDSVSGVQKAGLEASSTLRLSEQDEVTGSFGINLMNGEFTKLDFMLERPFTWDLPTDNPVLGFVINRARLNLDGLFIDGRQQARIGPGETGVTFDNLLLDVNERRISSGRILFDEAFALTLQMEGDTPRFRAVQADMANAPDHGVYFELGGAVIIDTGGIKTSGSAAASLKFGSLNYGDAEVVFSDDFALGLVPFEVSSGRADFYFDDVMVAWLDQSGLHPLISGLAQEFLPAKLPMPTLQTAYLTLRDEDGGLLIDIIEPGDGTLRLQTRTGQPLEMTIPLLDPSDPPVVAGVDLNNFIITATPGNLRVRSGSAGISLPENDPLSGLLMEMGLPLQLRQIRYGVTEESPDQAALRLTGNLSLFNRVLDEVSGLVFTVFDDGLIMGDFDLQNLGVSIPMLDYTDKLQLELEALNGYVTLPALSGGPVNFDLEIDAGFRINAASPAAAVSAITLQLKPGHMSLHRFHPVVLPEPYPIDLGGFSLILNEIRSLPVFDFDPVNGWDITVDLDADLRINLAGGETFNLPMNGVLLGNNGFTIPAQNISRSSVPGLDLPGFDLAGFTFKPLALRTRAGIAFNWMTGELPVFDPRFDFEVQLPDLPGLNPPDGLTFADVGIAGGLLSGSMAPYHPIGGILVPIGPPQYDPPVLRIDEIAGALEAADAGGIISQVVNLEISGGIHELPFFSDTDGNCSVGGSYLLRITEGRAFEGTIADVVPCGSRTFGPIRLSATSGSIQLAFDGESQLASLTGDFSAAVPAPDQGAPDIRADGTLTVDLIAGMITGGQLAINQPFSLPLPVTAEDPFILFTVNNALLNSDGLRINGNGSLHADDAVASVNFDNLLLGLSDFGIRDGRAVIAGGFGLDMGLSPLRAVISAADAPLPADDLLRFTTTADVVLDSLGLNYSGTGTASIIFQGESFASLRADFEDNFAFSMSVPRVRRGRALFYPDTAAPGDEPLAILDINGLSIGGGIIAALPDTIGLPSRDVAYVVIKDAQGNLLVNLESGPQGGYLLQTGQTPLPVVFPSLTDAAGNAPQVNVLFSLTTDDSYTPNGGSLSVQAALDLEPWTGLALSLDSLGIDLASTGRLAARLSLDLPEIFGEHTARGTAFLNGSGFVQGQIDIGTHSESYNPSISPFYERELISTLAGSEQNESITAGLFGARITFGQANSLRISGTLRTSLFRTEADQPYPLFYKAGYQNGNWDFQVEGSQYNPVIRLGMATVEFDEHNPFSIVTGSGQFGLGMNGRISFEEFLNEPVEFSFAGLELGAEQLPDNPRLYFRMGEATASLPEQTFSLFDDAVVVNFINPTLAIQGRTITASVTSGDLIFLGQEIEFDNLSVDTGGNFTIGSIETGDIGIIQQYLVLKQLGISRTGEEGLKLAGTFGVFIPDPIDYSTDITITVGRDQQNRISVSTSSDIACPMDNTFNLGPAVDFRLDCVDVDINPGALNETGVYVAGRIMIDGEERITMGEAGDLRNKPGISIKGGQASPLSYNVTGNGSFNFSYSFFSIDINANSTVSSKDRFSLLLNGEAGLRISGVSGTAGFRDMLITRNGIEDVGRFDGTASFTLMGIATLELGSFIHEQNNNGFNINIAEARNDKPDELQNRAGGDVPTQQIEVTELLCFGPCEAFGGSGNQALSLSLGGSNPGGSGGFNGSLNEVLFYRTAQDHVTLYIDGFEASIGNEFDLFASLHYEGQGDNGMRLRVAGGGNFNVGGQSAGAMVAGTFSNIGGNLSFGIFAAVRSDIGIPIVPGIVDLTGAGGGFFLNAGRDDIKFATDAINSFRGTSYGSRTVNQIDPNKYADKPFTVMLYAEVGIVGAAGVNVLKGQTFFAITGSSFYMDANGTMLGMDGDGVAGLTLQAGLTLDIVWDPDFFLYGNTWADLRVPGVLTGGTTGQGIEFFAGRMQGQTLWGVMGGLQLSVYGGLISGSANILAANQGFMLDATMGIGFLNDIPIISASGSLSGAIWYIDGAAYPFGAYATASISIKALITVSAELKAAFVTRRGGGFEFFGMGKGCINLLFGDGCLSGWILVGSDVFDYGIGEGKHADLIRKAQQQRDEFLALIEDTKAQLQNLANAFNEIPPFEGGLISGADAEKAGQQLFGMAYNARLEWANYIRNNENRGGFSIPVTLNSVLDNVVLATRSYQQSLEQGDATSASAALAEMEMWVGQVKQYASETITRLNDSNLRAVEFDAQASETLDALYTAMAESPLKRFITPPPPSAGNIQEPDFEVDMNKASAQHTAGDATVTALAGLDAQVREAVDAIEHNLDIMEQLLAVQINAQITTHYNLETQQMAISSATFDITPSVNTVSQLYANAMSAIQQYYARLANKQWAEVVWAENRRAWVNNQAGNIGTSNDNLLGRLQNSHSNRTTNTTAFSDQRHMMAERVHFVESLKDGKGHWQHNPYVYPNGTPMRAMYDGLEQSNIQWANIRSQDLQHFWYSMYEGGLYRYALESARSVNQQLNQQKNTLLGSLSAPLRTQTQQIDNFFSLKANMLSNLYSILDSYVHLKSLATDEDTLTARYRQRLQNISEQLQPPVLTQITVDPRRAPGSFFNSATIEWTATHPVNIEEVSIDIQEFESETDVLTGVYGYLTLGNPDSYRYSTYKSNYSVQNLLSPLYNTKTLNVGLRIRGPGGNVAYRRAIFNVDVGEGGTATPSDQNILAADNTPPENIILNLDSFYKKHQTTVYMGSYAFPIDRYMTNNPSAIDMHILSYDPESGISKFEYAIGTTRGGTDVVEWTELAGAIEFWTHQNAPAFMITGRSRIINMEPNQNYYVSVRSWNGAGLVSLVNDQSHPVVYDDTPPSMPGVAFLAATMPFIMYTEPVVRPRISTVPTAIIPNESFMLNWANPSTPREIKAIWAASTDEESGIRHYEYAVSKNPDARESDFENPFTTTNLNVTVRSGASPHNDITFEFNDERFIHVRAVNGAGTPGEHRTIGPLRAIDPTGPNTPSVNAYLTSNSVRIYIPFGSYDPETRVKGYQYAIGTTPGGTDIRNWPSSGVTDYNYTDDQFVGHLLSGLGCMCSVTAPYFYILKSNLPVGPTFYITVRGVNNRNMVSGQSITGPINLDTTPPLAPTITMSNLTANWLYAKVENVHDPESGFLKVEYKLEHQVTTSTGLQYWSTIPNYNWRSQVSYATPRMIESTSHIYANIPEEIHLDNVRIHIRITNGAGLQTVRTRNYFTPTVYYVN